jgi:chromatin assembly factor 1 subunit B
MEDVLDLSWSPDSLHLASGSVDNELLVWDIARGRYSSILTDHKGFVQGVTWDPRGTLIASASSDRYVEFIYILSQLTLSLVEKYMLTF